MDRDSGRRMYGVLGYPVQHSLSPAMHNAAFSYLHINAEYRLFEVPPEKLDWFLHHLDKEGICGLNITVPYKERILDFFKPDATSSYLQQLKAVNTIVKKGDSWKGFNTDIPGFSRHLKERIEPKDKRIAMLGAGGAARAVAYATAEAGARSIVLFDIDAAKMESVCAMVQSLFPGFAITGAKDIEGLDIGNKDILINATPVGLKAEDPALVRQELLHKNLFVYDLIYNPEKTALLLSAERAGARTSNGLEMLLYQGMLSFSIWTGKDAPKEIMRQALKEELKRCRKH